MRPLAISFRVLFFAATLLLLGSATAAAQQPARQGLRCGGRRPGKYEIVMDASSSLRRSDPATDSTEETYVRLIWLITGIACENETVVLHTALADSTQRMTLLDSFTPETATLERVRRMVGRAFGRDPGHTDLRLMVKGVVSDLLSDSTVRAVFVLTDGSFYPQAPTPRDRMVGPIRDKLTEFASLGERAADDGRLTVIGVGAEHALAVDPDLHPALPPLAGDRTWRWHDDSLDLKTAPGDSLLRAVFTTHYAPLRSFSLWTTLLREEGAWARPFGYTTGWRSPLALLDGVRMRHILFSAKSWDECNGLRPAAPEDERPQAAQMKLGGGWMCSIEAPTESDIRQVAALGPKKYAFLEDTLYTRVGPDGPITGLQDVLLGPGTTTCARGLLAARFNAGMTTHVPEAQLFVAPMGKKPSNNAVPLVRLSGSACLVPDFPMHDWTPGVGDYLFFVKNSLGMWVTRYTVRPSRLTVLGFTFRPGGFPFPPRKLGLLHLCVRVDPAPAADEEVFIELPDKRLRLGSPAQECANEVAATTAGQSAALGLDGVVAMEEPKDSTITRILLEGGPRHEMTEWVPVEIQRSGCWFLAWSCAAGAFLIGMLIQLVYLRRAGVRWKQATLRRATELVLSVGLSGILTVVFTEVVVMIHASPLQDAAIPLPLAILVVMHGINLVAAVVVPERIREIFLSATS